MVRAFRILDDLILALLKQQNSKQVLLFRHGETPGNKAGQLAGWTDQKLTHQGREQANQLFQVLHRYKNQFTTIHTSDLQRAKDTCDVSLGFPVPQIQEDKRLREIHFGDHENMYFSTIEKHHQDAINSRVYHAPNGESWEGVYNRAIEFFKEKYQKDGTHLAFTHGGLMCNLTYDFGLQTVLPNCSCVALNLDPITMKPNKLIWEWTYPETLKDMNI